MAKNQSNEAKRTRFNIVDLLFILLIVGVLAGVGWKLGGDMISEALGGNQKMTVTLRVKGALPSLVQTFKDVNPVGEKLIAGNEYLDATVTGFSFEQSRVYATNADGVVVASNDPERQDIVITVEAEVAKNTATPKIGTQEIRAGRTMTFKVLRIETYANIDNVVFG